MRVSGAAATRSVSFCGCQSENACQALDEVVIVLCPRRGSESRPFSKPAARAAPVVSADIRLTWQPIHRQCRSMTNASFTADVTPPSGPPIEPTPPAPAPAPLSAKEEAVDTVRFLALLAIADRKSTRLNSSH